MADADWPGVHAVLRRKGVSAFEVHGAVTHAHKWLEAAVREAGVDKRRDDLSFFRACQAAARARGVSLPRELPAAITLRNDMAHESGPPDVMKVRRAVRTYELAWCALTGRSRSPTVGPEEAREPTTDDLLLGPWRVLDLLGRGGMGEVLRCEHARDGGTAAVKVIVAEYAQIPAAQERFRRERNVSRRLSEGHGRPGGILRYLGADVEQDAATPRWIALELVDGVTLEQALEAGRLPDGRGLGDPTGRCALAREIGLEVARACVFAHDHDVAHRDLKPSNVMITPGRRVVLLDFGIARDASDARLTELDRGGPHTLDYAPPEALRGKRVPDFQLPLGDVYSLGVLLTELVTGALPEPTVAPSDRVAAVPSLALRGLLARMQAEAPTARPPMPEVLGALEALPADGGVAGAGREPGAAQRRRTVAEDPAPPPPPRRSPPPPEPAPRPRDTDPGPGPVAPRGGPGWGGLAAVVVPLLALVVWLALPEPPVPVCGDGNLDPGEACDDGNTVAGDSCGPTCLPDAWQPGAAPPPAPPPTVGRPPPVVTPPPPTPPRRDPVAGASSSANQGGTPRVISTPPPSPPPATPPPTPAPATAAADFPPADAADLAALARDGKREDFERLMRHLETDPGYLQRMGQAATKDLIAQSMQRFERAIYPSRGASRAVIAMLPGGTVSCHDAKIWLSWTYDDITRDAGARAFYDRQCSRCRAEQPDKPDVSARECAAASGYQMVNQRCVHKDNVFYTLECG